jgi:hypothetical protein
MVKNFAPEFVLTHDLGPTLALGIPFLPLADRAAFARQVRVARLVLDDVQVRGPSPRGI